MDGDADALIDLQSDLKATTENIAADAERLRELEEEKGRLELGDPRLDELGAEAEQLSERMAAQTKVESALVAEANDKADPGA